MERLGEFWSWRKLILVPICFTLFERDADKRLLMVVIVAVCSIYMVATWLGYFNLVELYRVPKHYLENHSTQRRAVWRIFTFLRVTRVAKS